MNLLTAVNSFHGINTVLAIDPGMSGAVVRMGQGRIEARRDFKCLRDIAIAVSVLQQGTTDAVIEQVGARPGQGVVSMFSFGKSTGVALGTAYAHQLYHMQEVSPQRWQNWCRKEFGIPRPQEFDSRALALRLFPAHADLFKRKKDHNTADAVLLGYWKLCQLEAVPMAA